MVLRLEKAKGIDIFMEETIALINKLEAESRLSRAEWIALIEGRSTNAAEYLFQKARKWQQRYFGRQIYARGLIEFTNFCKNNCYYCGIRRGNQKAERYRLTEEEIMQCCHYGFSIGFRTFVLQGGEDAYFTTERLAAIVRRIKQSFPECAVTLSVGEREREDYRILKEAGADRYLLRHETANPVHYGCLHPPGLSPALL